MTLRIGTRGSPLALIQSAIVAERLRAGGVSVETVTIRTSGDRLSQVALAEFGGKALFVKEIEEALLDRAVDIAVHSLKDLPALLPRGLAIGAYAARGDARDVLVTRGGHGLDDLPPGSRVGTSSPRRQVMLRARRPDLVAEPIRGNVDTRLAKLEQGSYEAIILAKAGLDRLGLAPRHVVALSTDEFVPAVGQGILAVEVREADREVLELVSPVDDTRTRMEALAERSFLEALGAGCHTPVAGHAHTDMRALTLTGVVASVDGRTVLRGSVTGDPGTARTIGTMLANELLARGAGSLLAAGAERER